MYIIIYIYNYVYKKQYKYVCNLIKNKFHQYAII